MSGWQFLRDYARESAPLNVAVVAIVFGGSLGDMAVWVGRHVPGWAGLGVACLTLLAQVLSLLGVLGMPSVQRWINDKLRGT